MPGDSVVGDSVEVIVYLNRGGLQGDDGTGTGERKRWKFEYTYPALQSRHIGDVTFRFDPGNPRSMIRENRNLHKAVICLQAKDFELSPQWFQEELQSALRGKPPGGLFEPVEADGRALFEVTKEFLRSVGDQLSKMDLSASDQKRRFRPRTNGGPQAPALDLGCEEGQLSADYRNVLRLWWLTLDRFHQGIESALHRQRLPDDQETRAIRATVLKLRAHLAASLLEFQTIDDSDLLMALHQSMLGWIDFNLGGRTRDDDIDFLDSRHEELGDLLFEVEPAPPLLQRIFQLPGFRKNGSPEEDENWQSSRRIAVRGAVLSAQRLQDKREAREIIERYADSLHRTGELFSKRYDVRELVAISNAWPEIRKAPARRQPLPERVVAFIRGTWRHLPWPYPAFLLLGLFGWILFGWNTSQRTLFRPVTEEAFLIVFSVQYSIVYAVLAYFIVFARLARKLRLFAQAMPKILGSLIIGYVPLWLPQETWTFPFYMSWEAVLVCTMILLVISYLYFAVEISGKVKIRSEALQKATAVFLIAAAQSYCIGLLITDFSARYFTDSLPPSLIGGRGIGGSFDNLHSMIDSLGLIRYIPNPLSLLSRAMGGVDLSGLAGQEFWLLPKLQIFWFGLAMFVAVFLHMLWEKEGILERV
jgi:hypothetical protein